MTFIENPSQTVGHYLPGEHLHRAADSSMFNESSPVEVANKLLHRKLLPQRLDPLDTVVWITEDTNFTIHRGFDYEAIQKAFEQAQRETARQAKAEGEDDDWLPSLPEFKRGGSTISQQLAKNLYLSSQRSFLRKGQEAALTVMLERMLTKRRILEIYLNVIEWGDGIYGAEAASQRYFRKPASTLTASEAAYLSAMIPNPRTVFNPQINPRRVARRQRIILRGMPYVKLP